jgi:hypothetical protein
VKQYRPASDQIHIVYRKGYQVVSSEDGGRGPHHDLGPKWPTPETAFRYAETLRTMPDVSPLRETA